MLLMSSILILLSSAVTFRRDKAISFNRITIVVLLYSSILGYETLFLLPLHTGIGIYGGVRFGTLVENDEGSLFDRRAGVCITISLITQHDVIPSTTYGVGESLTI